MIISKRTYLYLLVLIITGVLWVTAPFLALAQGLPDLVATAFSGPDTVGVGRVAALSWTVTNQGTGNAGGHYDIVYWSVDDVLDNQDRSTVLYQNIWLAPGESQSTSAGSYAPLIPGNYYLILKTDGDHRITESDETNNVRVFGPVTVTPPDLVATAFSGPDTVEAGQVAALSWTVTNQGTGNAGGHYDTIYWSVDDVLDNQDRSTTLYQNIWLAPGESQSTSAGSYAPLIPGNYYLILKTDSNNQVIESDETNNVLVFGPICVSSYCSPTANAGGPYDGQEGSAITMNASASDPNDDPLTYNWSVSSPLCSFDDPSALTPSLTCTDNNTFIATLTVSDGSGSATSHATVTVNNVAPSIGSITVPLDPVNLNQQPVSAKATFSDPAGANDEPFTCSVDYGDGQGPQAGSVSDTTCTGPNHNYAAAGVYQITLTVTDKDGATDSDTAADYIVIYNPDGGFVAGGGWIDSPAGAYKADPNVTGKANFGFVSEYRKEAMLPTGNTEFNFKAGGLNFHSHSYEWLVVNQGGTNAQYKGEGTINDAPAPNGAPYKFMLWAKDNDPTFGDTFRIRIWYEDNSTEIEVYDNGIDQAISGAITIHK